MKGRIRLSDYLMRVTKCRNSRVGNILRGAKREWFIYSHTLLSNSTLCHKITPTSRHMVTVPTKNCEVREVKDVSLTSIFPKGLTLKCEGVLVYGGEALGVRFSTGDDLYTYIDLDIETLESLSDNFKDKDYLKQYSPIPLNNDYLSEIEVKNKNIKILDFSEHTGIHTLIKELH